MTYCKFKVGDDVFSAYIGWLKVEKILDEEEDFYPVYLSAGESCTKDGKRYLTSLLPAIFTKLEAAKLWDMGFIKEEDYWRNHPDKTNKKDVFEELIKIQENAGFVDCVIIDAILAIKGWMEKKC